MILCHRFGFRSAEDDSPEGALEDILQRLETNGHLVVSVSVVKPGTLPGEHVEAYVVTRFTESPTETTAPAARMTLA